MTDLDNLLKGKALPTDELRNLWADQENLDAAARICFAEALLISGGKEPDKRAERLLQANWVLYTVEQMPGVSGTHKTEVAGLREAARQVGDYKDAAGKYLVKLGQLRQQSEQQPFNAQVIDQLRQTSEDLRLLVTQDEKDPMSVSVVIPVFFRKDDPTGLGYLIESLDSALAQDFDNPFDIYVVDDKTEIDLASALLAEYKDKVAYVRGTDQHIPNSRGGIIKIIKMEENSGGPGKPKNIGIREALFSGSSYLSFFDSDDVMMPDRLKTLFNYLEAHPTTDVVHGSHLAIDSDGKVLEESISNTWLNDTCRREIFGIEPFDPANLDVSRRHGAEDMHYFMNGYCFMQPSSTMVRSNVVLRLGLDNLHPTDVEAGEDFTFWQKAVKVANMDYLNHVVTKYREHPRNISSHNRV